MGTREIFRENLKIYRKKCGFTQEQLSELIGYGETYITEIESRRKFPKPETIDIIAEKLQIEPYLLFKNQNPEKTKILTDEIAENLYNKLAKNLKESIVKEVCELFYK